MRKIIVIGNSPAGVKAIEEIRATDQESPISLISGEIVLPYNRFLLPELLAGTINEKRCFYREESFYKKLNVEIVHNKKIVRINTKRNRVVFENKEEEKEEVNYDILIIADAATKLPDLKGDHREGIYGLRQLIESQAISKSLPLTEVIVVQSETFWGLEIIEALQKKNKEVIWLNPLKFLFSSMMDEQSAIALKQQLEAQGIRVWEDNAVVEILGDQEAKAVRLKSGKVLAADMIIFPDSGPDLKVYSEGGLAVSAGVLPRISVNQSFQTNVENVFALDQNCDFSAAYPALQAEPSLAALEEQGKTAAARITGREYTFSSPLEQDSILSKIQKRLSAGVALPEPHSQTVNT